MTRPALAILLALALPAPAQPTLRVANEDGRLRLHTTPDADDVTLHDGNPFRGLRVADNGNRFEMVACRVPAIDENAVVMVFSDDCGVSIGIRTDGPLGEAWVYYPNAGAVRGDGADVMRTLFDYAGIGYVP